MIDEIDYFQKRDKIKKKKDLGLGEDWEALKKKHTVPAPEKKPAAKSDEKEDDPPAAEPRKNRPDDK